MIGDVRITAPTARVLAALLADPATDRYGLELMETTGLASGSLYPILARLRRAGWLEARWEQLDPVLAGRPARRYYRLTPEGATRADAALQTPPRPHAAQQPRPAW